MYTTIAIDGACRGNGKPDCISAGACYILNYDDNANIEQSKMMSVVEHKSTSQRGELYGLLQAIEYVTTSKTETIIVTDSEYIFNTMTKDWVERWKYNGWKTAQGKDVKNKDLWEEIWGLYVKCERYITFFHIKGHLVSVGAKKRDELMSTDDTGYTLLQWIMQNRSVQKNPTLYDHAMGLSLTNNGFMPVGATFSLFASMNAVADAVANITVEKAAVAQWESILNSGGDTS